MKKALTALGISAVLIFSAALSGASVSKTNAVNGAALFKEHCASCHGIDASSADGGVHKLRGQTSAELQKKLAGYLDGTYGGAKKETMQRMAKKTPHEELLGITDYIETLGAVNK